MRQFQKSIEAEINKCNPTITEREKQNFYLRTYKHLKCMEVLRYMNTTNKTVVSYINAVNKMLLSN